jgi:hypothetical protein
MLKTLKSMNKIVCVLQSLTDLCKGCVPRNCTQVEFFVSWNLPKLNLIQIFFISDTGKITKVYFKMYNKVIKTSASTKENII